MAKNQNTFEKLRREQEKKLKAKQKRERKERKNEDDGSQSSGPVFVDPDELYGEL